LTQSFKPFDFSVFAESATSSHFSKDTAPRAYTPECILPARSPALRDGGKFDEQVAKGRRFGTQACRLQKSSVRIPACRQAGTADGKCSEPSLRKAKAQGFGVSAEERF